MASSSITSGSPRALSCSFGSRSFLCSSTARYVVRWCLLLQQDRATQNKFPMSRRGPTPDSDEGSPTPTKVTFGILPKGALDGMKEADIAKYKRDLRCETGIQTSRFLLASP